MEKLGYEDKVKLYY